MGTLVPTGLDAPLKLARVLEAGGHVAMLVDQHYVNGVDVTFFGRRCKANPFIARLARHIECPIHGTRVVRLPDRHRFRVELTEAIEPRARRRRQDRHRTAPCRRSRPWSKAGCASTPSNGCGCTALAVRYRNRERCIAPRPSAVHFPVLILVHSRFISRCVFGSCALMV